MLYPARLVIEMARICEICGNVPPSRWKRNWKRGGIWEEHKTNLFKIQNIFFKGTPYENFLGKKACQKCREHVGDEFSAYKSKEYGLLEEMKKKRPWK